MNGLDAWITGEGRCTYCGVSFPCTCEPDNAGTGEEVSEPKYIRFVPSTPKPKTKTWRVESTESGVELGYVAWYGRWRCYTFAPLNDTIYEKQCLRDIAEFCERETLAQRHA